MNYLRKVIKFLTIGIILSMSTHVFAIPRIVTNGMMWTFLGEFVNKSPMAIRIELNPTDSVPATQAKNCRNISITLKPGETFNLNTSTAEGVFENYCRIVWSATEGANFNNVFKADITALHPTDPALNQYGNFLITAKNETSRGTRLSTRFTLNAPLALQGDYKKYIENNKSSTQLDYIIKNAQNDVDNTEAKLTQAKAQLKLANDKLTAAQKDLDSRCPPKPQKQCTDDVRSTYTKMVNAYRISRDQRQILVDSNQKEVDAAKKLLAFYKTQKDKASKNLSDNPLAREDVVTTDMLCTWMMATEAYILRLTLDKDYVPTLSITTYDPTNSCKSSDTIQAATSNKRLILLPK